MTDPQKAKYLVHDPNAEETYYCESEAEALAIAKEALENIWPEKDEGREYRIEKIEPKT